MSAKHFSFVSYRDLRELVDTAAERYPNTEFFISSDKLLPYITGWQLRHCCCAFAHIVRSEGRQDEHIAVLGRNCAAWITAFFSIVTGGCVAVLLSVDAKEDELDYCVKKADCTALVYEIGSRHEAERLKASNPGLRLVEMHELVSALLACEAAASRRDITATISRRSRRFTTAGSTPATSDIWTAAVTYSSPADAKIS